MDDPDVSGVCVRSGWAYLCLSQLPESLISLSPLSSAMLIRSPTSSKFAAATHVQRSRSWSLSASPGNHLGTWRPITGRTELTEAWNLCDCVIHYSYLPAFGQEIIFLRGCGAHLWERDLSPSPGCHGPRARIRARRENACDGGVWVGK